jgi:hypothetical protein
MVILLMLAAGIGKLTSHKYAISRASRESSAGRHQRITPVKRRQLRRYKYRVPARLSVDESRTALAGLENPDFSAIPTTCSSSAGYPPIPKS